MHLLVILPEFSGSDPDSSPGFQAATNLASQLGAQLRVAWPEAWRNPILGNAVLRAADVRVLALAGGSSQRGSIELVPTEHSTAGTLQNWADLVVAF